MTQFLPPNLLALFAPRDPLPFLPPADKLPHEKKRSTYGGIGDYLKFFEDPIDTPPPVKLENREERKERKKRERAELQAYKIEQGIALWDPQGNNKATGDAYKTLFVARINYDTSESKLRREFEAYGPIRKIHLTYDKVNNKPRGYAFIEFEHERDMHAAYKNADGKKIDGRRVLVDVERGRTVKGWLPRRLGGGLGNTRRAKGPGGEPLVESRGVSRERSERRGGGGGGHDRRRSRSRGGSSSRHSSSRRRSRSHTSRTRDDRNGRSGGGGGSSSSRGHQSGGSSRHDERRRDGGGGGGRTDRDRDRDRDRGELESSSRRTSDKPPREHASSRRSEKDRGGESERDRGGKDNRSSNNNDYGNEMDANNSNYDENGQY